MRKISFLFPGQGSQSVGMGAQLAETHAKSKAVFERADKFLNRSLSSLMWDGPEETLKLTQNTQPALYVCSAAALQPLIDANIKPFAVAGHSLGEYSALYAADAFTFEDGLHLVSMRGHAFANAGEKRKGAMAAIIGLASEKVVGICQGVSRDGHVVVPANYNDPMQTVISGDPPAVDEACAVCKDAGAKRALPLPVSGAFHSPLVSSAANVMLEALRDVSIHKPKCHFIPNYTAQDMREPVDIRKSLVEQITSSVRWVQTIELLIEMGTDYFVEVGSGKVLAGLVRRINKDVPCYTTESKEALEKVVEELGSESKE